MSETEPIIFLSPILFSHYYLPHWCRALPSTKLSKPQIWEPPWTFPCLSQSTLNLKIPLLLPASVCRAPLIPRLHCKCPMQAALSTCPVLFHLLILSCSLSPSCLYTTSSVTFLNTDLITASSKFFTAPTPDKIKSELRA